MAPQIPDKLREQLRRYMDVGASLSKMNRAELEQLLQGHFGEDSPGRERLEDAFEELRARSLRGVETIIDLVRSEVRREVEHMAERRREEVVEVFDRAFSFLGDLFGAVSNRRDDEDLAEEAVVLDVTASQAPRKKSAGKKAPAKKAAAKKAGAKKAGAKKAAQPKDAPKKAAAKKSASKKAPSKRSSTTGL